MLFPWGDPKIIQTVHFLVELGFVVELVDEELVTVELSSLEVSVLEASVLEASVLEASVVDVSVEEGTVLDGSVVEASLLEASVLDASAVELVLVELVPGELEVETTSSDNSSEVASGNGVLEEGNALLAPEGWLEEDASVEEGASELSVEVLSADKLAIEDGETDVESTEVEESTDVEESTGRGVVPLGHVPAGVPSGTQIMMGAVLPLVIWTRHTVPELQGSLGHPKSEGASNAGSMAAAPWVRASRPVAMAHDVNCILNQGYTSDRELEAAGEKLQCAASHWRKESKRRERPKEDNACRDRRVP
ncbi:unnamed protein product [Clonostachys rosea]|uniref:Uncharacterized protein n=1 Tax=Bionectria ochroleuca TaxID=29856 RepID=A0ABY6UJ57_BIOOC|nr:unnamed protein product [Clonostachys rosea]